MKKRKHATKKMCSYLLIFAMIAASVSISPFGLQAAAKKKVTSISITKPVVSTLTLKKGSNYRLKAKVRPKNAANKKLKFKSSKSSVASVSSKGVIKAKKSGTATITVASKDGSKKKASIKVTVVNSLKKVSKITLSTKSLTLYLGDSASKKKATLSAKVSPSKATTKGVVYTTSNKNIASISKKGVITAKKVGRANITVYAADGWGKKATCKVEVKRKGTVSTTKPTGKPTTGPTNIPTTKPTEPPVDSNEFIIASNKKSAQIYLDSSGKDYEGLKLIADCFVSDVEMVSDAKMDMVTDQKKLEGKPIIAGSIGNNAIIDQLISDKKLNVETIEGKWETYKISVVKNPIEGVEEALVIAGSDKRGTIYGIFHISEMMGVSPWVYWADVMPEKKEKVSFTFSELSVTSKEPSVKYRGIFLNDEEPSLGTWANNFFKKSTGGKFNEYFYNNVFQVILRLKGNYLWPAMWGSAFNLESVEKPEASAELADKYGIVMGTSHHEPMMLGEKEWIRNKSEYGSGAWNFATNEQGLRKFFEHGAKSYGKYDNIATLGMRGEGDAPMLPEGSSVEDNINLLKDIILAQKEILKDNELEKKPTLLAMYKEVEDYWHGAEGVSGLKDWDELDGTIALLTEDNYGNLRTLPTEENKNRKGGWGMYYHFDYNGAPTSYQWIQTIQLQKLWEQMSMAYDYGVKDLWIVNVGDLKPMESAISYFLDMAWDFERWGTENIDSPEEYTKEWMEAQFGNYTNAQGIKDLSTILSEYLKLNGSRRPENITSTTYSIDNYNEAMEVLKRADKLIQLADEYKDKLPEEAQAPYYQLVYYPGVAAANVNRMQIYSGLNKAYAAQNLAGANLYAALLEKSIEFDKQLEEAYNKDMPGGLGNKWDGMMAQARNAAHVGYPGWQPQGAYPVPVYLEVPEDASMVVGLQGDTKVYKTGNVDLQAFTSINNETYYVNIMNGGGTPYKYTLAASQDWIKLTKTSGEVSTGDTIGIRIDFTKISTDSTGTVTVKGNGQEVAIKVSAKVIPTSGLDPMTFIEAKDYISIEAAHYANAKAGADGAQWKEIKNLGRTLSSLKVFPTTARFTSIENAPYVEYKVKVEAAGAYSMQTYVAPSNNVDWDKVTKKFGVSVDGGAVKEEDTISPSYIAGTWRDSLWSNGVRNGVHTKTTNLGNLDAGVHTIRIYAMDPPLALQKLVLYQTSKGLKTSYLGPKESYYVGKKVESELVADIQKQMYVASCTIPASSGHKYDIIIPKSGTFEVAVETDSDAPAMVDVLWNDKKVGQIELKSGTSQDEIFAMTEMLTAGQGKGVLSLSISSGSAEIKNVLIRRVELEFGRPMYVRASSEEGNHFATNTYSNNSRLLWKPLDSDTKPYLEFDFEENLYIDRIAISERGNNVNAYEIQVLDQDGTKWNTVYKGNAIDSGAVIFLHGKTEIRGEKLRIVFTDIKAAPSISRVSFTPYINWAREDKAVTLSGVNVNTDAAISISNNVIDGNRITKALEAGLGGNTGKSPYRFTMNFSEARVIDTVNVISLQQSEATTPGTGVAPDTSLRSDRVQATYEVSYYDGANWIPMGGVKNVPQAERKVFNAITIDEPVEAEKIRVDVYTDHWVRIVELEALQTMKSVGVEDYSKTKLISKDENEITLSEPCEIGKIKFNTADKESAYTFEYAQRDTDLYVKIPSSEYELQKTAAGLSVSFKEPMEAVKVRITPPNGVSIEQLELWGSVPKQRSGSIKKVFSQDFESDLKDIGTWASASATLDTSEHQDGNQSLKVSNRSEDYSAATVNIGSLLGFDNITTEYTFSCYIKSGNGDMNMQVKICDSSGVDQAEATGGTVAVKADGWTYFEYKFKMLNNSYQNLKIQTTGNNRNDYYIDSVKITKPEAPCTCELSAPYITNASEIRVLGSAADTTVDLQAETLKKSCDVDGHNEADVQYQYEMVESTSDQATITGSHLKVSEAGMLVVKVTANVNGITRHAMKAFEVVRD